MFLNKVPLYESVWNMVQSMFPTKVHAKTLSGHIHVCGSLRQGLHSHFKNCKSRNIHSTPLIMATKLPDSVETMLAELAQKNCIEPAGEDAREKLAGIGEESALFILQKISGRKIRHLTRFILHMIKNEPIPVHPVPNSRGLNYGSPTFLNLSRADSSQSSLPHGFSGATKDDELCPISGERRQAYAFEGDSGRRERKLPIFTEHSKALGKLDFPNAFLVLSYITPYPLEEVLSVQNIHDLQGLPFSDVESYLRKAVAMKANPSFPCEGKKYEWKPNKTHEYHCYVDCEGNCKFKGPFSIEKSTHLQRVLGDSNVLQVHFSKEKTKDGPFDPNAEHIKRFHKMAKEGIFVGLRRYQFFVFKGGDKENKKNPTSSPVNCYFVCTESSAEADIDSSYILFNKSIHQSRCIFMHAHTVPSLKKYMARFSLILSSTIHFEGDISNVEIKRIKDIPCMDEEMKEAHDINGEPLIQTDGTGFISEDLASQCPMNIYEGKKCNEDSKVCPLLIQCRLFYKGCAVKGTLLVNRELPCKSIHIRGSMIKVEGDASLVGFEAISSLEICATSRKPKPACLSRYLIALLNYGGVPEDFFIELVHVAFDQIQNKFRERRKALEAVKKHKNLDDYHMALRMLSCGIPLHEPLLQSKLKKYMLEEIQMFKRGKVPLEGSFYLMGTADPTGQLKRDEVCVILDHGQICGKVLVYRHPGVHFGDIHVFKATYVKDIEKIVGDSKFAIFFSIQGPRSSADEIAKGDFDGDIYWVSTNAKVLNHFKPGTPWERPVKDERTPQPRPTDFSYEELEDKLIQEFLNLHFAPSYAVGVAADSWLAYMDRLLTPEVKDPEERETLKKKMLRLTDIYYDALDAPKSGGKVEIPEDLRPWRKPHFLKKNPEDDDTDRFYTSSSILGKIYDQKPSDTGSQLDEIWTIPCFQDVDVAEFKARWRDRYDQSRSDMAEALESAGSSKSLRSSNANIVIQKYKKLLYEETDPTASSKSRQQVHVEASALYQVVYEYAQEMKDVGKCAFAWKVAGEALCEMYLEKQQQEHILISPSILYESIY